MVVVIGTLAAGALAAGVGSATGRVFPGPTPPATCGPGSLPETGVQGRVPAADYASGRAAAGYLCNTEQVAHQGSTGGFKVQRYTDSRGNTCAFYDSTRLFPLEVPFQATTGFGVIVLDMADPANPRVATTLKTPAMLSPHESLLVSQSRGLLAAVMGNPATTLGVLEVYDVREDCRAPKLLSTSVEPVFGHESGWSPDGNTFYAASTVGNTLAAIDLSDPTDPKRIFTQTGVNYHGLRLADDGRTMYAANIGNDLSGPRFPGEGLRILDVSQIQDRVADPQVRVLSDLTWPEGSIPQVAEPFTRAGRDYVLQVDEFARYGLNGTSIAIEDAPVGAARIIDVDDPQHPVVVSNLRLQVQQPDQRTESIRDPGAGSPVGGYTGHYCSIPTRQDPQLVACSMIGSGLRIFDISDLEHPREAAYFNKPQPVLDPLGATSMARGGSNALSQPAWDVPGRSIWYSDGSSGFYVVRLTNGVQDLLAPVVPRATPVRTRLSVSPRRAAQVRLATPTRVRYVVRAGGARVDSGRLTVRIDGRRVARFDLARINTARIASGNGARTVRLPRDLGVGKHRLRLRYTSDAPSVRTSATSRTVLVTVRAPRAR